MSTGLRERKKLRTKAAIQREAMRLFLEKGFDDTTIEDIAEAADISPSTFFNYFPTKEDVVFEDELDPLILAAFNTEPADEKPLAAIRNAMTRVFSNLTPEQDRLMRQRIGLMVATPALRAAMLTQFSEMVDQVATLLASRVRRPADDFAVRNLSGALLGVMMSALITAAGNPEADLIEIAERAMKHLEAGLPL